MNHSPELGELAAALVAAQGAFTAVPKGSTNPFFKSKYAGLPAVVEAASPILVEHGLAVTQLLGHDSDGDTLTTTLLHKSGQFLSDTMHLRPVKDDPQAQGSATTYGRRYAYMAILGLVADEDDDGNAGSTRSRKPAPKPAAKPAAQTGGTAKADSAPAPTTGGADSPAPSPADTIPASHVSALRTLATNTGRSADWLSWALVAVGATVDESITDVGERIRSAIEGLSLEQAVLLAESMGGKPEDLA